MKIGVLPESIGQLTHLTTLHLADNNLTNLPEWFCQLTNLTILNLGNNQLSNLPKKFSQLSKLTAINLTNNNLTNLSEVLCQLPHLITLVLSNNKLTTLPEALSQLVNLDTLNLSTNQLASLPCKLDQLTKLTTLDLSGNKLTDWPEALSHLTNLTDLNLAHNKLASLPESIGQLTNLTSLNLNGNKLTYLPEALCQLTNLIILSLDGNNLDSLPEMLGQLTNLSVLNLKNNVLIDLSDMFCQFHDLQVLLLDNNQFAAIPDVVYEMNSLRELSFGNSFGNSFGPLEQVANFYKISTLARRLPMNLERVNNEDDATYKKVRHYLDLLYRDDFMEGIGKYTAVFPQIETLEQSKTEGNHITTISPKLLQLDKLEKFKVRGNPITTPPPEIVAQGLDAIRNYFQQAQQQGMAPLYAAKVLIVGEPGAGKTTLLRKLVDPDYLVPNTCEDSTLGVDVHIGWEFPLVNNSNITFTANLWDFGGQQIQYLIHHFFLTSRSLYILVADDREQRTDFDYWFRIIELLGNNSPLLVVLNEKQHRSISNFDRQKYRERYAEFFMDTRDVDFSLEDGRIDALRRKIQRMLAELPHVGTLLPKQWISVRRALEMRRNENYLTLNDYFAICREYGISNETDQLQLSGYLHDLGIVLHFQHDPGLVDMVIVNPVWATRGVYQLLSDNSVVQQQGRFSHKWLGQIWKAQEYNFLERGKLLALMLKDNFELCFKLSDNDGGEYLAPQLLPTLRPKFSWNERDNLRFRFQYPFLPKGLISRLIVRLGDYIEQTAGVNLMWGRGAVFNRNGVRAWVEEDETRRDGLKVIDVAVSGGTARQRREFLTQIRGELGVIHHRSFATISYDEMIPCNCPDCCQSSPTFFEHKTLLKYERAGRRTIVCEKELRDVVVKSLLDGVKMTVRQESVQQQVVKLLTSLPCLHDADSYRAFILSADIDEQLIKHIHFDGSTAQFVQLLVSTLLAYGRLEDERHPLIAILEAAKQYVGRERQIECQMLIEELE